MNTTVVAEVFEVIAGFVSAIVYRYNNGRDSVEIWPAEDSGDEFMMFKLPYTPEPPTPNLSTGEERLGEKDDTTYALCTTQLLALDILGGE